MRGEAGGASSRVGESVQASVFWLCGVLFFAVQIGVLVALLRARHARRDAASHPAEIVWTLVPAALLAALALMASGLTEPSWSRVRSAARPLAARRADALVLAVPAASPLRR